MSNFYLRLAQPQEYLFTLPNLCSVPPELEVPELVISSTKPGSRDPYRDRTFPYTLVQKEDPSPISWRQEVTNEEVKTLKETPTKKQLRRKRTVFSAEVLLILTTYYEQNKFLNPESKAELLLKIALPSNALVMWFQNRRAKERAKGVVI